MIKLLNNIKIFLNSKVYPLFVFLIAFIAHTFSIEEVCAGFLIFSAIVGLLICDDLKFIISPLFFFIFMFSEKSVSSDKFFEKPYLIAIVVLSLIVLTAFVFHFILHKKNIDLKSFYKSKLVFGVVLLSVSFLTNGLFSSAEYKYINIIFAFALIACLLFVYFIFSINLQKSENLKDYIFYILFLLSILLSLQVFVTFASQPIIENGQITKESLLFGWGMWNNMGGMLAFFLPAHFYFTCTVKKYGFIFYLTGIISYVAIILTLSRSSLLVASLIIIICIICCCFIGCNKLQSRILTFFLILIGIVCVIFLREKILSLLNDFISRGFDDNGRFKIYAYGILNFLANPVFGRGFYSPFVLEHQFISFLPFRFHNTIIQMMTTCGTVGLVSYLWHRFETIRLISKKRNKFTLFIFLSIASLLLCSLLDNHFFNLYPTFIYSVLLVILEKAEK